MHYYFSRAHYKTDRNKRETQGHMLMKMITERIQCCSTVSRSPGSLFDGSRLSHRTSLPSQPPGPHGGCGRPLCLDLCQEHSAKGGPVPFQGVQSDSQGGGRSSPPPRERHSGISRTLGPAPQREVRPLEGRSRGVYPNWAMFRGNEEGWESTKGGSRDQKGIWIGPLINA